MPWGPLDIEELHKLSQRHNYCPFYAAKSRAEVADLIFMPYNYLIDSNIRERFEINYSNAIIIFDEAHNIAPVAEDVSSFEIKAKFLETTLAELSGLTDAKSMSDQKEWKSSKEGITKIKCLTQRFMKFLRTMSLNLNDHPNAI